VLASKELELILKTLLHVNKRLRCCDTRGNTTRASRSSSCAGSPRSLRTFPAWEVDKEDIDSWEDKGLDALDSEQCLLCSSSATQPRGDKQVLVTQTLTAVRIPKQAEFSRQLLPSSCPATQATTTTDTD